MVKRHSNGLDHHQKEFINLVSLNARRYRKHEVFRDFCELAALSISNAVDLQQRAAREARYMQIVARYERAEIDRFPMMLAHVTMALETGFHDCLGQLFMALELGDHWKGQFFTPYSISYLMARLSIDGADETIRSKGFITVNEPAAGAGAMLIGVANVLQDLGLNYQQCMHVTAQDIDETAVHMCYIQLALLHVPGVVIQGNSLMVEERSHWYTPAHILGGWNFKLRSQAETPCQVQNILPKPEVAVPVKRRQEAPVKPMMPTVAQLDLFA
jgi:hypothetical protein